MECQKGARRGYCFKVKLELDYAELICLLETSCGMSIEQIAKEGRFSRQSINNWRRGLCQPDKTNKANLLAISKAHGLELPSNYLSLDGLDAYQKYMVKSLRDQLLKQNEMRKSFKKEE